MNTWQVTAPRAGRMLLPDRGQLLWVGHLLTSQQSLFLTQYQEHWLAPTHAVGVHVIQQLLRLLLGVTLQKQSQKGCYECQHSYCQTMKHLATGATYRKV